MAELRPDVLATRSSPAGFQIDLRVPPDLACFPGHFKQAPLLPGVVQLSWVLALAHACFSLPSRVTQVAALKFMRAVMPGATLSLDLSFNGARRELSFCFRDSGGRECSSGRIGFIPDDAGV
jgi:3-hydroxymyristoyl/3-hydroxydecanoyl-(acyl carrier protein) dehydratase